MIVIEQAFSVGGLEDSRLGEGIQSVFGIAHDYLIFSYNYISLNLQSNLLSRYLEGHSKSALVIRGTFCQYYSS